MNASTVDLTGAAGFIRMANPCDPPGGLAGAKLYFARNQRIYTRYHCTAAPLHVPECGDPAMRRR